MEFTILMPKLLKSTFDEVYTTLPVNVVAVFCCHRCSVFLRTYLPSVAVACCVVGEDKGHFEFLIFETLCSGSLSK